MSASVSPNPLVNFETIMTLSLSSGPGFSASSRALFPRNFNRVVESERLIGGVQQLGDIRIRIRISALGPMYSGVGGGAKDELALCSHGTWRPDHSVQMLEQCVVFSVTCCIVVMRRYIL